MIHLNRGRGQLAAIFDSPGERIEARIDGTGCAAAMIEVDCAQTNHRAEGVLPGERGKLQRHFGIRLELHSVGAGSFLILVDHQRADEADAVIAKMPSAGVAIGGAGEGRSAENQQIAAAIEELLDGRPGFFGKRRAIRKNQKAGCGRGQSSCEAGPRPPTVLRATLRLIAAGTGWRSRPREIRAR